MRELSRRRRGRRAGLEEREVGPAARDVVARGVEQRAERAWCAARVWSSLIGFSRATKRRRGSSGARRRRSASPGSVKLQPTISYMPRPTSASIGAAAQALLGAQAPGAAAALGQRGGQLLEAVHAGDLLDEVGLARDVVAPEGGHQHLEAAGRLLDGELQRAQDLGLARARDRQPRISCTRCSRRRMTAPRRAVAADVDRPGHEPRAGQLEHEPRGDDLGLHRLLGREALLEAPAGLAAQAQQLGGAVDVGAVPVGGLHQHARRALVDLGALAAHDPGDRRRPVGVVDDEHLGVERAHLAVERGDLLAVLGAAHRRAARRPRGRGRRRGSGCRRAASRSW